MRDFLNDRLTNDVVKSVYPYNELSIQELLNRFYSEIKNTTEISNKALDFLKWLVEQGLEENVVNELQKMYDDGRLTQLIDDLANDLQSQVNTINTNIGGINTRITTVETSVVNNTDNITNLTSKLNDDINNVNTEITDVKSNVTSLTTNVTSLTNNLTIAENDITNLKQQSNNKKIKHIGFALRNVGGVWQFITDSSHSPLNGATVEIQDNFTIKVKYGFTANKVISFVATPDEVLAQKGVTIGASVGLDEALIKLGKQDNVFGYIIKNGGDNPTFTVDNNYSFGVTNAVWNSTRNSLEVTHEKCNASIPSLSTRNPNVTAYVATVQRRASGFAMSEFRFKNSNDDSIQAIPPDGTVILFSYSNQFQLPLAQVDYDNSNIWCYGIMEV